MLQVEMDLSPGRAEITPDRAAESALWGKMMRFAAQPGDFARCEAMDAAHDWAMLTIRCRGVPERYQHQVQDIIEADPESDEVDALSQIVLQQAIERLGGV